jgi:Ig-like domain from next to BRCA1 gene
MTDTVENYVKPRAKKLGLSIRAMCAKAEISPQSYYDFQEISKPNREPGTKTKLPDLRTIIRLAEVLEVHPLRLTQFVFDATAPRKAAKSGKKGDKSGFVADVTYPDGALVMPNQRFTKTWEIQNLGTVAWTNRFLKCVDQHIVVHTRTGESLTLAQALTPVVELVSIPATQPGDLVRISVEFTAPRLPGTVLSYWKAVNEHGDLCFPASTGLWCKVQVTSLATAESEDRFQPEP